MHWATSTLVWYLVPLKCTCSADKRLLPLSRGAHVQFIALMMSCRPFKFLILVTSDGKRCRGLCLGRSVLGKKWWVGQGEFFFFIIKTTTASFVPNAFFTTDYQELAPDRSNTDNNNDDDERIIRRKRRTRTIRRVRVVRNKQKRCLE